MDSSDLTLIKKKGGQRHPGKAQKIAKQERWRVNDGPTTTGILSPERTSRLGIILLPFTFHISLKVNKKKICLPSGQC